MSILWQYAHLEIYLLTWTFYHRKRPLSRGKLYKIDNRSGRIAMAVRGVHRDGRAQPPRTPSDVMSDTQFERKAVMIHMAMVKDVMFGKTMRKSYAKYETC